MGYPWHIELKSLSAEEYNLHNVKWEDNYI